MEDTENREKPNNPPVRRQQKNKNEGTQSEAVTSASGSNADAPTTNSTSVPNGQSAAESTTQTNNAQTGQTKTSNLGQNTGSKSDVGSRSAAPLAAADQLPYTPAAKTDAEVKATHNRLMQEDPKYGLNYAINTILQQAKEKKPETDQEREAREKKEKRQKIWAAVGDGLAALSNLYFTTKGAPSMYGNKGPGMQDALQTRIDKDKADRDAREKEYKGYMAQLSKLYMERGKTVAEMEAAAEARKLAKEKAEREQERYNREKFLQDSKQKEAEAKAQTAQAEAQYADTYYNNRAKRVGTSSGGRGVFTGRYPVLGKDGEVKRRVYSKEEAKAATEREGGTWPYDVTETKYETEDPILGTTSGNRTTVKKSVVTGDANDDDIRRSVKKNKKMPGTK